MNRAALTLCLATLTSAASAQIHHRRAIPASLLIQNHKDNNSGAGCTDYACGGRCYDGHGGTDLPVPLGTTVHASAAGVVLVANNGCANYGGLGNSCGGYCGNYVLLQHDDGNRTIYCHMMLDSLRVSRGDRVECGEVIGLTASSGSSTGPHLHHEWRDGRGVSVDFFRGACSPSGGLWTQQNPYPQTPGDACDGPPPPPPCIGRNGPFGWSCSGPIDGMTCTQALEASDPHTWADNYFCSDVARGIRWSSAGPIAGMTCTAINEASEPAAHTWGDNYLCLPPWSVYRFQWSSAGPIAGRDCLRWAEPVDPDTWDDNFLCWTRDATCTRVAEPFAWSCAGAVAGRSCVAIAEAADPHTWTDNYFCGPATLGLRWSSAGPIAGMDCVQVGEGSEPAEHTWADNYLCAARGSGYAFRWSTAGPITGMQCIAWYEPGDPHTWEDNFLCWTYTPPAMDASVAQDATPAADVVRADVTTTDVVGRDATPTDAERSDVPAADVAERDVMLEDAGDVTIAEDAVDAPSLADRSPVADAPSTRDAAVADLPPIEDVWIDPGPLPAIEGGCACRAGAVPHRGRSRLALAPLCLALMLGRRRARRSLRA